MMLWLVVLGVIMGWVESVYEKPLTATDSSYDWYAPLPEPPEYLSNKVAEPDDTPEMADTYVRYMGSRR